MDADEMLPTPQNISSREKTRDWALVYVIVIGFCLGSIGLILMNFWIGIAGLAMVPLGAIGLFANGVMAHTEPRAEGERAYGGNDENVPRLREETRVIPG